METTKASSVAWPAKKKRPSSIDWVCHWSLCACLQQFTRAALKSTLLLPADLNLLTPAQAGNVAALQSATLWFGAVGAGAAVLAMLLKSLGRAAGIRRALAGVGLASAVAIHCVITWILGATVVTTPPKDGLLVASVVSAVVFVFFAVVDAKAALALLAGAGGEKEE